MARPDKDKEKKLKPLILEGKLPTDAKGIKAFLNKTLGTADSPLNIAGTGADLESPEVMKGVVVHPTGILGLDRYLGIGGFLGGRILDVFGWEGTGKTLTALMIGAFFQSVGKRVAFVDAEGTLSPQMARSVGVNLDELIIIQSTPEKVMMGEDYLEAVKLLLQLGVEFIIVDSVPALVPGMTMQKKIGEGQKSVQAQMMSEGLQQMIPLLTSKKTSCVYFINQMRGVPMAMFGPSEKETGGNALKFYASVRLGVRKKEDIIEKIQMPDGRIVETQLGVRNVYTLEKNKTAIIPIDSLELDVYFQPKWGDRWVLHNGTEIMPGVDVMKDMVEVGVNNGVIKQESSWFTFGSHKCNGKAALANALKADAVAQVILREQVLSAGSLKPTPPPEEEAKKGKKA